MRLATVRKGAKEPGIETAFKDGQHSTYLEEIRRAAQLEEQEQVCLSRSMRTFPAQGGRVCWEAEAGGCTRLLLSWSTVPHSTCPCSLKHHIPGIKLGLTSIGDSTFLLSPCD